MGRSVDYLIGATAVVYYDVSEFGAEQGATCEHCGEYYYSPLGDTVDITHCCVIHHLPTALSSTTIRQTLIGNGS